MESTWGGALCWWKTKQGTKWTPGQIKIHQDIWIGCPVSKLFAGIKSKVKWNVPLLHISVTMIMLECVRHTSEWENLLYWPVWFLTPQQVMIRYAEQSEIRYWASFPFLQWGPSSTMRFWGKSVTLPSSWPFGKMPAVSVVTLATLWTFKRLWELVLSYEGGRKRVYGTGQSFPFLTLWSTLLCPSHTSAGKVMVAADSKLLDPQVKAAHQYMHQAMVKLSKLLQQVPKNREETSSL